jgi:hypothetical protein
MVDLLTFSSFSNCLRQLVFIAIICSKSKVKHQNTLHKIMLNAKMDISINYNLLWIIDI